MSDENTPSATATEEPVVEASAKKIGWNVVASVLRDNIVCHAREQGHNVFIKNDDLVCEDNPSVNGWLSTLKRLIDGKVADKAEISIEDAKKTVMEIGNLIGMMCCDKYAAFSGIPFPVSGLNMSVAPTIRKNSNFFDHMKKNWLDNDNEEYEEYDSDSTEKESAQPTDAPAPNLEECQVSFDRLMDKLKSDYEDGATVRGFRKAVETMIKYEAELRQEADQFRHKVVNIFYCSRLGRYVSIHRISFPSRKIIAYRLSNLQTSYNLRLELFLNTIRGCKNVTISAEEKALAFLKTMITEEQYRSYVITGAFYEQSKRSGVVYYFRKLKPTVALRMETVTEDDGGSFDEFKFLAGLCMHPTAYFERSFAGANAPTDDIIAHLKWMRGDERRFWAECNHHAYYEKELGLP